MLNNTSIYTTLVGKTAWLLSAPYTGHRNLFITCQTKTDNAILTSNEQNTIFPKITFHRPRTCSHTMDTGCRLRSRGTELLVQIILCV